MKKTLQALEIGNEVENAASVKMNALAIQSLSAVIGSGVAIANVMGHSISVTAEQATTIAGGAVAAVGGISALVNIVTTKRIGLKGKKP